MIRRTAMRLRRATTRHHRLAVEHLEKRELLATLADFDAVAFKFATGETAADTPTGILASPAPVSEAAVNFLLIDDVMPLYVTSGLAGSGEASIAFGFVDSGVWTPSDGDGMDLASEFEPVGDRVYVRVDAAGNVDLVSAANFSAGQVIASNSVTLDPNKPFHLVFEEEFDWAYVYHGTDIIAEGDPFLGANVAQRINLGDDFVVSVKCTCDDEGSTASAVINDRARDATLNVHEFPIVMREWLTPTPVRFSRDLDVLLADERADLAITLTNDGSFAADNVVVELKVPAGSGMSVEGDPNRSYGRISSGGAVTRTFSVRTDATPVGVYTLDLTATWTGGTQTLNTTVVVWEAEENIVSLSAGEYTVDATTPFADIDVQITAPEVFVGGLPAYFDIQQLSATVTHAVPFVGTHWGDMEEIGPAAQQPVVPRGGTGNVTGKVAELTANGAGRGIAGAVVKLIDLNTGKTVATDTTTSNGAYGLGPARYGAYKISVLLPKSIRRFRQPQLSGAFELGAPIFLMGDWLVVPDPVASSSEDNSSPATSQGASGTKTKQPTNTTEKPTKEFFTPSRVVGALVGLAVGAADLAIAPKTLGGGLLSLVAGTSAAAGADYAADPADADLFYVGQENTPPLNLGEITETEHLDVTVAIDPPLSVTAPSQITTNFTYTRTTNLRTYTYSGSETLDFDFYLPLDLAAQRRGDEVVVTAQVTSPDGTPLVGPRALVDAWLWEDPDVLLGNQLLHDDGQFDDAVAGDGIYTGTIVARGAGGDLQVAVFASRGGVSVEAYPASHGFAAVQVRASADFDENGDVDNNDLMIWQTHFGESGTPNTGDADRNLIVDGNDFLVWQAEFGTGVALGGGQGQGLLRQPRLVQKRFSSLDEAEGSLRGVLVRDRYLAERSEVDQLADKGWHRKAISEDLLSPLAASLVAQRSKFRRG